MHHGTYSDYCFLTVLFLMTATLFTNSQGLGHPPLAIQMDPCSSGVTQQTTGQSWDEDIIPYTITDGLSKEISRAVQQSMYLIESKTCLRFLPYTNQQDYIEIQHNFKCCSHQGRVGNGLHELYLHESCAIGKQLHTTIASAGLVDWELLTVTNECKCGGSVYVDHPGEGIITSPGYPHDDYVRNLQCAWKLWISSGTTVELEIVTFELEDDIGCNYDFMELVKQSDDGKVESRPLKLCGNVGNKKLNFTSGSLSLRFKTDMDIQAKGFKIKYRTYTSQDNEVLCSEFNGGCSHLCIADEKGIKQHCSCRPGYSLSDDAKTCKDIDECSSKKGGCNQRCKNTEGSYYCHCNLQYGLSEDDKHKCEVCGGNFKSLVGEISSPGYPSRLPPLQNCQWVINLRSNHFLQVTITNLSIPISERCVENYLKLQHGSFRYKKRICGKFSQIKYIVKEAVGSSTNFRFRSSNSDLFTAEDYSGFTLSFQQVPITELTQQELDTVYVNNVAIPYETNNWLS